MENKPIWIFPCEHFRIITYCKISKQRFAFGREAEHWARSDEPILQDATSSDAECDQWSMDPAVQPGSLPMGPPEARTPLHLPLSGCATPWWAAGTALSPCPATRSPKGWQSRAQLTERFNPPCQPDKTCFPPRAPTRCVVSVFFQPFYNPETCFSTLCGWAWLSSLSTPHPGHSILTDSYHNTVSYSFQLRS